MKFQILTTFFKTLKNEIAQNAYQAVIEAEKIFGRGNGTAKKKAAIEFILNALKIPPILKNFAYLALSTLIDVAIETAVNALPKTP